MNRTETDRTIDSLLRDLRGPEATELLFRHPSDVFGSAFNAATQGVDAEYVGRLLAATRRALERMVCAGRVRNAGEFEKAMRKVLAVTARHFRLLSWYRAHPVVGIASAGRGPRERRAAVVTYGIDAPAVAAPASAPSTRLEGAELFPALLRGARRLGHLGCRVVSEYRRYQVAFGKRAGAYPHLARRAVMDEDGRVVTIHRSAADPGTPAPPARVVRQVRSIHLAAVRRLRVIARDLGFDVPRPD